MSRISRAMCVLNMLSTSTLQTGESILNFDGFKVCKGKLKKKSMYYISFKKLSPLFMKKELLNWANFKAYDFEPDVVMKNTYGDDVFLYEL